MEMETTQSGVDDTRPDVAWVGDHGLLNLLDTAGFHTNSRRPETILETAGWS